MLTQATEHTQNVPGLVAQIAAAGRLRDELGQQLDQASLEAHAAGVDVAAQIQGVCIHRPNA